jgi:hypothetical protein
MRRSMSPAFVDTCAGGPVALVDPGASALIPGHAHHLGGLGLDELLHHHAHRLADHLDRVRAEQYPQDVGYGRLPVTAA